ncbi:protein DOUBLE-STRAND BREAK FORMATION [Humulus lupulus]|uniref:protein DOUBLE-STRAND BREAK FORMATION n=1 Tax=Humulus lupulus TaxID=3486 RepID=UPI002B40ECF3|nr:protein DOUBLE-STRAND BREAK FORMATION [Humulus lupulus]
MSDSVAQQISLFRSLILSRRLDGAALRIIESVMVSKDVRSSSMEVRSSLRDFIGSESISVMRENADKPVEKKLLDLNFLVRASALLGDVENCLALRYEALLLREFKSTSCQWLEVSHMEWLNFAEQSLDYGFHSIARKACENALLCFQKASKTDSETTEFFEGVKIIEKIKRLKDCAMTSAVSRSVQVQAERYTKSKLMSRSKASPSVCKKTQRLATTLFRNGIRKRNLRYLHESQSLVKMTDEPSASRS